MKQELLEKSLPSNEDAERIILGAIILDNESGEPAFANLSPSDFYNPIHRYLFESMVQLYEAGDPIHPITIGENLKTRGYDPSVVGGVSAITNLTFGVPGAINLRENVDLVKKHSVARKAIRLMNEMTSDLLRGEYPVEEVLDNGEARLLTLTNHIHTEGNQDASIGFWDLSDIVPEMEQEFVNYHLGISSGAPSGMPELDKLLDGGGFQPAGVYLVGASEKTGKTSLALDWGYNEAVVEGYTVPIVTLEMAAKNLAKRLYSSHTGIPYYMFRPGFYDSQTDKSYSRALDGLKEFGTFPIKIADRLFGLNEIGRHLRRVVEQGLKAGKPVRYAIIDYLQLIEAESTGKNGTREREVSSISRGLKKLASELGIALIVMSSLNREGLREGQEPTPFNLRDSGALAFDCEALLLLHNPAYVPGKPYEPQQVTDMVMILSRQRNGPTGRIPMKFIGPYMQFMTESQYRKHFKDKGLPQSIGQAVMEDKEIDSLWDSVSELSSHGEIEV